MRATINAKWITDRESLYALLCKKLNLPADCGKNLDAVHDFLTEPGPQRIITIKHETLLRERLGDYADRLFAMLDSAARETERITVIRKG